MTLALNSAALFLFQESGGGDVHRGTLFLLVIAVALVAQAVGVVMAAFFALKMFRKIEAMTNSFDRKTTPIIENLTTLTAELTPKVRVITTNIEEISYTVREKCDEVGATLSEINRTVADLNLKTRVHVSHVDVMVTEALASTEEVSRTVQESIKKPVRQIAGIIAGLRAGIETLAARSPFGKPKGYENPYDL
jgi:methyl-accepting chemotaxis protein